MLEEPAKLVSFSVRIVGSKRYLVEHNPSLNMLELIGLPKNSNGFRTTHTCELCGFEPKTKNKYREKQDHLVMKHFKDRIDKIFPHCRPYTCPSPECEFVGKDKQALLRHYTGKHGVLELYLREALQEKGIQYQLSDNAKRKSAGHSESQMRKQKEPRLSSPIMTNIRLSPIETVAEQAEELMAADTTTPLGSDFSDIVYTSTVTRLPVLQTNRLPLLQSTRLPSIPTTKLPSMSSVLTRPYQNHGKCDVDALLASFQPLDGQLVLNIPNISSDLPIDSPLVSSTTPDFYSTSSLPDEPCKVVLNDNIMWGGGNLAVSESAQTVPVQYIESSDPGFVNLGDIDYDYLYPATIEPAAILACSNQERQLSFSML